MIPKRILSNRATSAATLVLLALGVWTKAEETAPTGAPSPAKNEKEKDAGVTLPKMQDGWRRERFALKKGRTRVELTGYLQEDFRHFDWRVSGDIAGTKQAKERELRRIRFGSKVRFGDALFEITVDPRKPVTGSRLNNFAASYAFAKTLTVRVGLFKLPGSREFQAPTNATDFLDRSMIATRLVPARDWGVSAAGVFGRVEYLVGAFKGDGQASLQRSKGTVAGRLSVDVAKGLQLTGSLLQGRVTADPLDGTTAPYARGASGVTPTGFTFWNRPFVSGTRRRGSGTLSYSRGSFRFLSEYLETREERLGQGVARQDLPDVVGRGWSAQASLILTGEKKVAMVEPRQSVFAGGVGAIELVARAEAMSFDDSGPASGEASFTNRAANIAPAGVSALEAGLNYWASNFLKLQTTAMWEKYSDPRIPPNPGRPGRYFSLLAQVQFMIP